MKKKNIKSKKPKQPRKKREPTQKQKQTQNIKINLAGLSGSNDSGKAQAPIIHYSNPIISNPYVNPNNNPQPQTNPPNADFKDEISKLRNDFQQAYKDAGTKVDNVIKSVNEGQKRTNDRLNSIYSDFYKPQSTTKVDNIVNDILSGKPVSTPPKSTTQTPPQTPPQNSKVIDITPKGNNPQLGYSRTPDIRLFMRSPTGLFMPNTPLFLPNSPIKIPNVPLLMNSSDDTGKDIEKEIEEFEAETNIQLQRPQTNPDSVVDDTIPKEYICPDCGKSYPTIGNLNRHLRTKGHGGKNKGPITESEKSQVKKENSLKRKIFSTKPPLRK